MSLWLLRLLFCVLSILPGADFSVAADIESAKHAYQQKDYSTAFKESTPLAEKGDPDAQLILGKIYMLGQGVPKDADQAIKWLKASGTQGNADAQFFLGTLYLLPHKDIAEGVKWMRLSAEQGNQDAQLLLGQAYLDGSKELPRDAVQGDMWLRLAAKDNLPFYQIQLRGAERQISPDQIAKGAALAAAWKPKPGLRPEEKPNP